MDSTFLGKLFRLDWGNGSTGYPVFRRGTILDQDYRGCLLGVFVEIFWRIPNFLETDSRLTLLGKSVADLLGDTVPCSGLMGDQMLGGKLLNLGSFSGELRYLGRILQLNLPWHFGGQGNRII